MAAATALQLGLRLDRLETVSEGNVFGGVRQTRQLVGPVLRMSSEPAAGLGTFKRGLSRGFKLPTRRDAGVTWQPRPRLTWRLSVAPLLARDDGDVKSVRVTEAGMLVRYPSREAWRQSPAWRLGLDSAHGGRAFSHRA